VDATTLRSLASSEHLTSDCNRGLSREYFPLRTCLDTKEWWTTSLQTRHIHSIVIYSTWDIGASDDAIEISNSSEIGNYEDPLPRGKPKSLIPSLRHIRSHHQSPGRLPTEAAIRSSITRWKNYCFGAAYVLNTTMGLPPAVLGLQHLLFPCKVDTSQRFPPIKVSISKTTVLPLDPES
jgi:hypothetical protein